MRKRRWARVFFEENILSTLENVIFDVFLASVCSGCCFWLVLKMGVFSAKQNQLKALAVQKLQMMKLLTGVNSKAAHVIKKQVCSEWEVVQKLSQTFSDTSLTLKDLQVLQRSKQTFFVYLLFEGYDREMMHWLSNLDELPFSFLLKRIAYQVRPSGWIAEVKIAVDRNGFEGGSAKNNTQQQASLGLRSSLTSFQVGAKTSRLFEIWIHSEKKVAFFMGKKWYL